MTGGSGLRNIGKDINFCMISFLYPSEFTPSVIQKLNSDTIFHQERDTIPPVNSLSNSSITYTIVYYNMNIYVRRDFWKYELITLVENFCILCVSLSNW